MLTKNDLKAIGQLVRTAVREEAITKEDAKNFATKDDLKNFATKDDLKHFATKDDLKPLTTKGDLKKLEKKLDTKFTQLFNYIDKDLMETQRKVKIIEETLRISPVS